jgi:hypothetical protein
MNATRDSDAILNAWLDEGPTDLPDATRRAILTSLPTTPQARRGGLAPWIHMTRFARAAVVVLVAVVAIGWLVLLARPKGDVGGPGPSPSASPTPSVFRSPLYGYSIELPTGWSATPATTRWDGESQPSLGPNVDQLAGPHLIVLGYAGPFSGDLTAFVQDRIAANARDHSDTCPSNALQLNQPTTIGGQAGVLLGWNCGARIDQAITLQDGFGYAFTIRDAAFSPTLDPTDFASVQSTLDSLIFPVAPIESP